MVRNCSSPAPLFLGVHDVRDQISCAASRGERTRICKLPFTPRERVETGAATVAGLVAELMAREDRYALAFADLQGLRVALDQQLAEFDAPLAGVREVAFFPPMTGG